jgi:hypothetical protein
LELVIEGLRFDGLHAILAPPGIRLVKPAAIEEKQARLEIEVAADAPAGIFPFHVLCKAGLSNPKLIRIGEFPQIVEQEDNNELGQATPVSLPCAVNATMTATDVDCFRFEAAAGQHVVFDVEAHRLGSPIRPVVTLFDAQGRQLAASGAPPADIRPDNRLEYTFANPGTYIVRLHDLTFEGADFSVYYLRMGGIPFAASMFPLGGQRGTKVPVTLSGGTLAQDLVHLVDLSGEVPWSRTRIVAQGPGGPLAAPALFAVGGHAEAFEQEPNDQAPEAQAVTAPVTINGRIQQPGDRDSFAFDLPAGGRVTLRVLAHDLGSPLDSFITITDASGTELATADDRETTGREPPVVRSVAPQASSDPLLDFTAPAAGKFVVTIEDRSGFGGPNYAYRLEMAPQQADFELLAQPGRAIQAPNPQAAQQQQPQVLNEFSGAGTGALSIDRGGTATVVVRAIRNGYNGPIELAVEGLPASVQVGPAVIAAGQNETVLAFNADFEAPGTAAFVKIVGRAALDAAQGPGQAAVSSIVRQVEQPLVLSALPINGAVQHEVGMIALGISQQGAELAVRGRLESPLVQAGTAVLKVTVRRREGYVGDVALRLLNIPTGLSASAASIPAGSNEVELQLAGGLDLSPGRHVLLVEGTLAVPDRPEPFVASFPLDFDVLPLVALELAAQQVEVAEQSSTNVDITVHLHGPLVEAVELSLSGLPKGVSVAATSIPPGTERFALVIEAGEGASASPIRRIVQVKARTRLGEQVLELPTMRFALKVTKGG